MIVGNLKGFFGKIFFKESLNERYLCQLTKYLYLWQRISRGFLDKLLDGNLKINTPKNLIVEIFKT
jgi:hypothetical protein